MTDRGKTPQRSQERIMIISHSLPTVPSQRAHIAQCDATAKLGVWQSHSRGRRLPARLRLDQLSKQDQLSPVTPGSDDQQGLINRGMLALVCGRTAYRSTSPTKRLAGTRWHE
jgi:hypothetical protein